MIIFTKQSLKRLLVFFFLSLNLFSCAQTRNVLVKSYAFYVERVQGNFPEYADEAVLEGKTDTNITLPGKVDTSIVIYIETKNKLISWDMAWQKGQAYIITAIPIEQTPFQAGNIKGGSQVIITPSKGNFLWQLQLSSAGPAIQARKKITKEKIILKGRYKGKTITWKTGPLLDLIPLPSV
jgi:hypothetical protein